jgi:hypothetical protein
LFQVPVPTRQKLHQRELLAALDIHAALAYPPKLGSFSRLTRTQYRVVLGKNHIIGGIRLMACCTGVIRLWQLLSVYHRSQNRPNAPFCRENVFCSLP